MYIFSILNYITNVSKIYVSYRINIIVYYLFKKLIYLRKNS